MLFDDYIWQQFTSHRTRGSKYYLSNTQNRNPKQVPNGLWRDVLLRQLREENFN
ncbi:MAG: hypothetical protein JWO09_133 [Bacteroidetes bacterium]|nr:hypothetical protein [Bacteroidota bacterium]